MPETNIGSQLERTNQVVSSSVTLPNFGGMKLENPAQHLCLSCNCPLAIILANRIELDSRSKGNTVQQGTKVIGVKNPLSDRNAA